MPSPSPINGYQKYYVLLFKPTCVDRGKPAWRGDPNDFALRQLTYYLKFPTVNPAIVMKNAHSPLEALLPDELSRPTQVAPLPNFTPPPPVLRILDNAEASFIPLTSNYGTVVYLHPIIVNTMTNRTKLELARYIGIHWELAHEDKGERNTK